MQYEFNVYGILLSSQSKFEFNQPVDNGGKSVHHAEPGSEYVYLKIYIESQSTILKIEMNFQ